MQLIGRLYQSFEAVRHAHGTDVADDELSHRVHLFPQHLAIVPGREQAGLDAVLYDRNLLAWNIPMLDQVLFEGGSDNDDVIGLAVEKARDSSKEAVQSGTFAAHAHCSERFRPKVTDLENERHSLGASDPPSGETNQQLRRSRDDHIRARHKHAGSRRRYTERAVVEHALVRFAIGKGQ